METELTDQLITFLSELIHSDDATRIPVPGFLAENPDFLALKADLEKLRAVTVFLKAREASEKFCDPAEFKAIKDKLIESEARHRLLVDNANDIITTVSLAGKFTYVSPSVEKLTGYTVEEFIDHYQEIGYFLPETLELMERTINLVNRMENNGEHFDSVRYESCQCAKNGHLIWTDTVLSGIYDENGQLRELLGVTRDITEKVRLRDEIIRLSQTDKLTQLYNRSKMDEVLEREYRRSNRSDTPFSVILLDVDHFKWINDRFGHQAGDQVLFQMGQIFRSTIRSTDTVGRWGGEEFLFILPDTDEEGAIRLANKIRLAIADFAFDHPDHITVSQGVAVYRGDSLLETLIARADDAMYAAKKAGRNQVQAGWDDPEKDIYQ